MISQKEILLKVIKTLNQLKIPYMLTGGTVTNLYGRPRTTHDADFVVDIKKGQEEKFYRAFKDDFLIDRDSISQAIKKSYQFDMLAKKGLFKIDFWILKDTPFAKEEFKRRVKEKIAGVLTCVISPEDFIITKLNLFKDWGASRHFEDVKGVYEVQKEKLDFEYLKKWLTHFFTKKVFEKITKEESPK